eukprot:scaffold42455_cov183-Amphora_coffeaeformis.AAC.2
MAVQSNGETHFCIFCLSRHKANLARNHLILKPPSAPPAQYERPTYMESFAVCVNCYFTAVKVRSFNKFCSSDKPRN